jgi:hypothetical protein
LKAFKCIYFIQQPIPLSSSTIQGGSGVTDKKTFRIVNIVQNLSLLRWPDGKVNINVLRSFRFFCSILGLSFGPDGLYITASALFYNMPRKEKNISELGPFHILRLPTKQLKKIQKEIQPKIKFNLPISGH